MLRLKNTTRCELVVTYCMEYSPSLWTSGTSVRLVKQSSAIL